MLPNWFHDSGGSVSTGTTFTATQDWSTGYQFDVTVNHLNLGFNTLSAWAFYVPGVSEPLFDLANKHTGFTVQSDFHLDSDPTGFVTSSGYQLEMWADALGNRCLEDTIRLSVPAAARPTIETFPGGVAVSGSVSRRCGESIRISAIRLLLDGISGTA